MKKTTILSSFICICLIKLATVVWLADERYCLVGVDQSIGGIAISSGDTWSYTGAMENYIQHGTYFTDNGNKKVFAGRLPHYSIPYYLFRQFFSEKDSNDLLVLLQVLIESWAIVVMGLLIFDITKSKVFFLGILLVFAVSLNWSSLTNYISPESLSISFFCLALYYFYRYQAKNSQRLLVLTGLFLAVLGMLKPYLLPLYLPIGIYFLLQANLRTVLGWFDVMKKTLIISIPLLMLITPWIIRNYAVFNRFVPFQDDIYAGYNYSDADLALRRYITSWGERYRFWYPGTPGCFFDPRPGFACEYELPDYLETSKYSHEDILQVRDLYIKSKNDSTLLPAAARRLDLLAENFKNEHPFYAYGIAPFKLLRNFVVNSGSYYLPFNSSSNCHKWWHILVKISQSILYWVTLPVGITGLIVLYKKERKCGLAIFLITWLVVFFPLILRETEWRMFHITYPVLVLGFVYIIHFVFNKKLKELFPKAFPEQ